MCYIEITLKRKEAIQKMTYRRAELLRLIDKTAKHLEETKEDIIGYLSELKFARKNDDLEYATNCKNWLQTLFNTYRYLIDEYNNYHEILKYTFH